MCLWLHLFPLPVSPPHLLNCRLEAQEAEVKALARGTSALRGEAGRLDAALAEASGLRGELEQDSLALEGRLAAELKVSVGGVRMRS